MADDNIILTGFMGTGKTTTGRLLAARLGREFVDTDELIVARDGRAIADIFNEDGETHFRELEAAVAQELARRRGLVVATGGRLMLDPANATALGATGPVFCLTAEPEDILGRVAATGGKRPLLDVANPEARVRALLAEHPDMPATVIAERVEWDGSITWFRENVRRLRPEHRPVDPADRLTWAAGDAAQCDLWFPPRKIPLEDGSSVLLPVLVIVAALSIVILFRTSERWVYYEGESDKAG